MILREKYKKIDIESEKKSMLSLRKLSKNKIQQSNFERQANENEIKIDY